ncbi:hypothetical protein Droror1_Dr00004728 [Drosera rotundifolia]
MNINRAAVNRSKASPFESFLEGWLVRQEHHLDELITAASSSGYSDEESKELVSRVLRHYEEYYDEKSRDTRHDVFRHLSPPWCTPLECAFLWIGGFRPGVMFQLVAKSVDDLSSLQAQRLDSLRIGTGKEEKKLADALARIQETAASPSIVERIRRISCWPYGDIIVGPQMGTDTESLRSAMETLVANADRLRTKTAAVVVDVLTPKQSMKFLDASAESQRVLWSWGSNGDLEGSSSQAK